jgi:chlorobactene glucosyltransferase
MAQMPLFWLLSFALIYLLLTSIVFIRNRFDLVTLTGPAPVKNRELKISVCIPARNEENSIPALLQSLLGQNDDNFDIHVLDDQSEDNTSEILKSFQRIDPEKIFIHSGSNKPDSWLGKPWACEQLGQAASGDILLFLDADTTLQPDTLTRIRNTFSEWNLDMLTVWPNQILDTFWEKTVIPLIYYGLSTILPAIYVYRKPRWMPDIIYKQVSPGFAAANGQCIAFTRDAYRRIGGHASVKQEVVEDVQLARKAKTSGLILRMFNGVDSVSCRMYHSQAEMFQGLRKNFLAGFGSSLLLFLMAAILHLVVFILPFGTLIHSLIYPDAILFFLSAACVAIILLHRLILSAWFSWDPLYSFTHPVAVCWFQWLGLIKIYDVITGRKTSWKGRDV